MTEVRRDLLPRDKEKDKAELKAIIEKIEELMYDPKNEAQVSELLKKASGYVTAPDRVLDRIVVEQYYSWTSLDGLVDELTVAVSKVPNISREDFAALAQWIADAITNKTKDVEELDNYYHSFFELNFPHIEDIDIFGEIMAAALEGTSLEKVVDLVYKT